eukprot:5361175-Alexandrium_andersonii.AAC.1
MRMPCYFASPLAGPAHCICAAQCCSPAGITLSRLEWCLAVALDLGPRCIWILDIGRAGRVRGPTCRSTAVVRRP